jgi:hypothetical protein
VFLKAGLLLAGDQICIERIDLFDQTDNHLLFVTFSYDALGRNTGRSVFNADSTFLQSTSFTSDAQGAVSRENSINFDSNSVSSTALSRSGGKTSFSVMDQFGLDMLGGAVSYPASTNHSYALSQGGAVLNTVRYQYADDGRLTRIEVLDAGASLVYYATVKTTILSATLAPSRELLRTPSLQMRGAGRFRLTFELRHSGRVSLEVFSLNGRRLAALVDRTFSAGRQTVSADLFDRQQPAISSGVYMLRLSINGKCLSTQRYVVQRP